MARVLVCAITLSTALGLTASGLAYDPLWYRADQWSGEYPSGFTMTETRTVELRERPDPNEPRTVPCRFEKDATYHPWNRRRVSEQSLQFVSFTKSQEFVVQTSFSDNLFNRTKNKKEKVNFNAGDRWRYLESLAEGQIVLKYRGSDYESGQTLFEHSTSLSRGDDVPGSGYDEWMRVCCPGGTQGWLLMRDIADAPGFGPPNIIGYGRAADHSAHTR